MDTIILERFSLVIGSKIKEESTLMSETSKMSSVTTTERSSVETDSRDSLSTHKIQNDQMKSAKAEMGEVREENGRLKLVLTQIMKDYQSLQQENLEKYEDAAASSLHKQDHDEGPDQLVALSLGRFSLVEPKSKEQIKANNSTKDEENGKFNGGLALRLDGKYDSTYSIGVLKKESPTKSFNELKELKEPGDTWPPNKKSSRLERNGDDEEEVNQQNPSKKARVSVRAICSAPTMNDGCQWRKYGQKISKGNPSPRAYYRCTVSPSCPVRKHVQRCAEDISILVTTYEGAHNHPLPPSATAMASTTSAAVSMLRSSSSTSQSGSLGATTSANLHGLNSSTRANNSFYIPNGTTTISTYQLHPTITLDLTTPAASSHYNKYASTFIPAPKYSPTCLNFSAANSSSPSSLDYWGALSNNKNHLNASSYVGLTQLPSQSIPPFYQPYYNKIPTNNSYDQPRPQQCFTEKIAAATKEITSNPIFQSALAAAITSIVGKRAAGVVENSSQNVTSYNGVGCATSYSNKIVVPSNPQQGNLTFSFPPVLPFSSNKGPFVPDPANKKDQVYRDISS